MATEALKRETHDGCDGCRYEEIDELTSPCASCKQNYTDKYVPKPKHDRDWIVGCIEHDGFIKTDRGDKANQIILKALEANTVEIVRCKDCRFAEHREQAERVYCHRERLAISCPPRDNDDFCKYGERSE